jgi:hypothetical protein
MEIQKRRKTTNDDRDTAGRKGISGYGIGETEKEEE